MSSCDVAAIGWVIALFGLIVNHRLTGQRDTRKEIRGELDKFLVALKVLRDAANESAQAIVQRLKTFALHFSIP